MFPHFPKGYFSWMLKQCSWYTFVYFCQCKYGQVSISWHNSGEWSLVWVSKPFFSLLLHLLLLHCTSLNYSRVLSGCPNPHQPFSLVLTIRHTPTSHHPNIHQILTQHFITFLHESFFFQIYPLPDVFLKCALFRGWCWETCILWCGENQAVGRLREIQRVQLAFILEMWDFTK